jgi:hypothetical protein
MTAPVLHVGPADPSTHAYQAARDLGAGRSSEWRRHLLTRRECIPLAEVEERRRG